LLAAKKKSGNTSNYVIAADDEKMEKSSGYLGRVKSNFLGTEFLIEDTGADYKGKNELILMKAQ